MNKVLFLCFWAIVPHKNWFQIAPLEGTVPCINFNNVVAKSAPNLSRIAPKKLQNLHHCGKLMQIRWQKDTGTKMQKCLVGFSFLFLYIVI